MNPGFGGPLLPFIKHKMAEYTTRYVISTVSLSCICDRMCIIFGRRIFLCKQTKSQSNASTEYSGLQSQVLNQSRYFLKNNFSKTVGTGISATSTTQSSSPQHPMQKSGNRRHVPSLLNPHFPIRLDLLKRSHSHDCRFSY
jgi:hypothetical protein